MNFFKNIGKTMGNAVSFIGEKNRRAACLNRIRTVIRCEEKAAEKEYLALGRYYYNNLRDRDNPVTEAHCAEVDVIEERLEKALDQLERFYSAEIELSGAAGQVDVIEGEDGPTAVYGKGGEAEEITLDDVESFDHDPLEEPATEADFPVAGVPKAPLTEEPGENDNLPFEG